jgi:hypothetical protein
MKLYYMRQGIFDAKHVEKWTGFHGKTTSVYLINLAETDSHMRHDILKRGGPM